jgi:hypothetical protein
MRTISLIILVLGLTLGACASQTPPPRTTEPAPVERSAGMTPAEGSGSESGTPEVRPAPRDGETGGASGDMAAPKPESSTETGSKTTP